METDEMRKDLKVRLPVKYHVQLQTLKILKGKNMANCVMEALDAYFAERHDATEAATTAVEARELAA